MSRLRKTGRRPGASIERYARGLLWAATLTLAAGQGFAHDLGTTEALITLHDQRFEILLECDLDALALGAGPGVDDAELAAALRAMDDARLAATVGDLRQLFARRVRLLAGDTRIAFEVEFPDREAGRTLGMVPPTFLGLTARLRGALPEQESPLRFRLSRAFPSARLTVIDANGETLLEELVPRGEDSSDFGARRASPAVAGPEPDRSRAVYWLVAATLAVAAFAWNRWRGSGTGGIAAPSR